MIGHGPAEAIQVAADEDHLVEAVATVEPVVLGGQQRFAFGVGGQIVRDDLEQVVARPAEDQVAVLPIQATAEDVVTRATEDPVLRRTAHQHVVARTAEQHVTAHQVLAGPKIELVGSN